VQGYKAAQAESLRQHCQKSSVSSTQKAWTTHRRR